MSSITAFAPRVSVDLESLGLFSDLHGADARPGRGINSAGDIVTRTADGRDLNDIWNEFQATLNIWNEGRQRLVDILTYPVTQLVEDVPVVGGVDFEEASEFGVAKAARPGIDFFSMGYDFKWYDTASRFTWMFLAEAPANRVEAVHQQILEGDNRLVFRKVMGSLFSNVNRTASISGQPVNVYTLYNGDSQVPPAYKGKTFASGHNHFLVSGGTVIDSGDVEATIETIAEHGFGPAEGSQIVMLMNKQEVDAVRRFRSNVENSNGAVALYDFIPAGNQPTLILPSNGLLGSLPPTTWNGLAVVGSYGNALIIEESYIPAGYVVAFATGGQANLSNPIGIREHANVGLRGLRLINGEKAGYPIINSYYQRGFGTGVRQRGAAAIMQIKGSGTYAPPAAFPYI
jgi:hypothetical protein